MIKASVIYPRSPDSKFDATYYASSHLPMVKTCLGAACLKVSLQVAVDESQPFHAIGELVFASTAAMQQALAPHEQKFVADMVNYTNITPMVQLSTPTEI